SVPSGATITLRTRDCFDDQIRSEEADLSRVDWERANPSTGPVHVEGAQPGDVLKVTIQRIELAPSGVMVSDARHNILGRFLQGALVRVLPVGSREAEFGHGVRIPLAPMVGVIGVAPAGLPVKTDTPGRHGGNMDCSLVTEGAVLYFNVEVPGALFALGDVHGAMGDGEILSGIEMAAQVTVTLDVVKGRSIQSPVLESRDAWSVIESAPTLDQAAQQAVESMYGFLSERQGITGHELSMLMSLVGKLSFCQIVDPLKTVRFDMPKEHLGLMQF
ncbi:MAG TPA: acetamidase/formamidase family protein, partial [Holophaga sp.]|nr:acetamidase/formamidase family protein [Holophaga sp.]